MKEVGFEEFNTHAVWKFMEPQKGEFDFAVIDQVLEVAASEGMRVFLSVHPLPDPRWFHMKYAGDGMVDRRGRPAYPRNRVALCWDNPHFREHCTEFIQALVNRYKSAPPLAYWNAWTEPNWIGGSPVYPSVDYDQLTCYCPYTAEKWSEWLRAKYGDVDRVNAAWRIGYGAGELGDWSDVTPPTALPGQWGSYRAWLDWRAFIDDRLTDLVQWVSDTIKATDGNHPTHSNLLFQSAVYNPTILGCDVAKMAGAVDILGSSVYVRSTAGERPELLAQTVDVLRSAASRYSRSCWVTEYQAGPIIWSHDRAVVPTPDDLFLAPFQAIAHGAKGFYYWMWRPRMDAENGGWEQAEYGMTGKDGTLRDRAVRAGAAGRFIRDHEKLILSATYTPRVAILRSQALYHLSFGEVIDEIGANRELPVGDARRFYTDSVLGAYRLLWEEKIPVGFVTPDDILLGRLKDYAVLVMPFAYMLSEAVGAKISDFARGGGVVVADFGCAMKNEVGAVYPRSPGAGLADVFGAEEFDVASDERAIRLEPGTADASEPVRTHMLRSVLRADSGAVVIGKYEDGASAVTLHEYGRGAGILVGTLIFRGYQVSSDPATRAFVRHLVGVRGEVSPVTISGLASDLRVKVEASVLTTETGELLIAINHNSCRVVATADVKTSSREAWDLMRDAAMPVESREGGVCITLPLEASGVAVIRL
jgi:beta-galactosidase GanA